MDAPTTPLTCQQCEAPLPLATSGKPLSTFCVACLERAANEMTDKDWNRELGAIFSNILEK